MTLRTPARFALGFMVAAGLSSAAPAWADQDLVKRGEYLATAGDCVACHSAPDEKPFAGGLYMPTPVGKISTPNITPDKDTGIGTWSDDQFYKAMHEGIGHDGEYLYPVFPFPWYTKVTKDDALAIKAYLFSLPAVHAPRKPIEIGFPFDVRTGLFAWRTLFFKAATFEPDSKASAQVNRGAYLVEGLGHCGECHNKDNLLGASVWSGKLEGGQISGWYAPNITSDGKDGVGRWQDDDIVKFLKTGERPNAKTVALGPMHEVITESTSHMNDDDLHAIAAYLKATGAKETISQRESSKGTAPDRTTVAAYLSYCAACHQQNGEGAKGAVPSLVGNGAVTAKGPENVIRVVLGGAEARDGLAPMPAFGARMSDQDIADAVNYVRSSWGNQAPADVGPGQVSALRKDALTMLAMTGGKPCAPYPDAALDKAISDGDVASKLGKMNEATMLLTIDDILPAIKKGAPQADPDKITNALTAAYCPIAQKLPAQKQSIAMGDFATTVYGEAKRTSKPN